jgi:hypothetical protein
MATRPIFLALRSSAQFVREVQLEFKWFAGVAASQKQKSIASLHEAAKRKLAIEEILEISSKSPSSAGVRLSAFNLTLKSKAAGVVPVEVAYQAAKRFELGGPFLDLLNGTPREAKADERLRNSGRLLAFDFDGASWPLEPKTAFYDWLYLRALESNPTLAEFLTRFGAFTDIEFNPEKSINCQARSAALYVALQHRGLLKLALGSPTTYLGAISQSRTGESQRDLF